MTPLCGPSTFIEGNRSCLSQGEAVIQNITHKGRLFGQTHCMDVFILVSLCYTPQKANVHLLNDRNYVRDTFEVMKLQMLDEKSPVLFRIESY